MLSLICGRSKQNYIQFFVAIKKKPEYPDGIFDASRYSERQGF